ncbi:MAG: hypothetical protein MUE81_20810 [Thermoflexibacter sp.]|nr:hypothetical protein [Thermoflexibacter sp.]
MSFKSLKYFTLFCFLFLHDYARAQDFKFWHLDSKNGLPSATVNVLLQDYQGFMWIGAIDGLYKYDGYGFKPFKFRQADKEGLWGSNISLLYEDSRQTLWIGTTGKGLHYYDKNQEKVIRLAKTEGMYINALKEDKNGELWLSNNGLLGKLDLKNLSFNNQITNELKEKLPTKLINDFVIVNPHEFWIGTADEGLFFLNLKTQEVQQFKNLPENPNTLSSNHIKKLYLDKEQILWVGTREGGLCKFDTKKREFQLFKHDPNDSLSIGSNTIFDIAEINNQLWVATDNGGLSIIDKQNKVIQKIVYQKDITTSISINNIRYIYQDAAKRIWVGTHTAGISIIDNLKNKFSTLNLFPTKQVVSAVFRDGKNRLWVGADGGLHQISESNKRKVFVHNPNQKGSLGGKSVRNITEDEKQNIWIGGWASGLNLFDEKTETFKVFMSEKENTQTLSNSNVLFIKESKKTKKLFVAAWEKLNQLEDLEKGIFRRITNQVPDNIKTEVSDLPIFFSCSVFLLKQEEKDSC